MLKCSVATSAVYKTVFYRPPTKLGEGNVFTNVYHSVRGLHTYLRSQVPSGGRHTQGLGIISVKVSGG